jgi:hypothetical protein
MTNMDIVIDENYGKFGYEANLKAMFHHWKGFLMLEEVKHVAETTNPIMVEKGLVNVIADHNEMELFSDEVSAYIAETWIPEQEKAGVKNIFVVLSAEAFAKFAAEEMHEHAKEKAAIDIRHFASMEDAIKAAKEYNAKH